MSPTAPSAPPPPSSQVLTVREATPDDIPELLDLIRSAYRGETSRRGWTTEADLVADERIDAAGLLLKINEPFGRVLIAWAESSPSLPVACCEVLRRADDGEVAYFGLFAVDPERQGGGIGKAVLDRAEAFARATWGVKRMEMCVIWTREELIAWYARRGYVRTGEKKPFPYEHLVNGVALRDDLYFDVLVKAF